MIEKYDTDADKIFNRLEDMVFFGEISHDALEQWAVVEEDEVVVSAVTRLLRISKPEYGLR